MLWGQQSPRTGQGSWMWPTSWGLPMMGAAGHVVTTGQGATPQGLMALPGVRGPGHLVCLCEHS